MTTLTDEPGVRLAIGGGVLFVAIAALSVVTVPTGYAVAALLILSTTLCLGLPLAHAALLAGAGWALTDGFALHRLGQLALDHGALLLFAGFAAALVVGRPVRGIPR